MVWQGAPYTTTIPAHDLAIGAAPHQLGIQRANDLSASELYDLLSKMTRQAISIPAAEEPKIGATPCLNATLSLVCYDHDPARGTA